MAEAWAGGYIGIVALSVVFFFLATPSWALQPEGSETQKPLTRGLHQLEFVPDNGVTLRCSLDCGQGANSLPDPGLRRPSEGGCRMVAPTLGDGFVRTLLALGTYLLTPKPRRRLSRENDIEFLMRRTPTPLRRGGPIVTAHPRV